MKSIAHNITLSLKAIRWIKNWHIYFLDYFGLAGKKIIEYRLKNKLRYHTRGNSTDRGIITSVCLEDEYLIKKEGIKENSVIIDVGAQIGIFSVFATGFANSVKVYSVEPVPENFQMLANNIEINNLQSNIKAYNNSIGEKDGQNLKIYLSESNTGEHSMALKNRKHFVISQTITLQKIFEENSIKKCNLLKMDCEGGEYLSLYNTPDKIFKRISKIYLEYHDLGDNPEYNGKALKEFLEKKGFKVQHHDQFLYARKTR